MMPTLIEERPVQIARLKSNVTIIGWLGEIASSVTLICAALMLQSNTKLTIFMMHVLGAGDDHIFESLSHFLLKFATLSYAMSLINIIACTLLIIGVKKGCSLMLFPWLLYNGIFFTIAVQISTYIVLSTALVDFALSLWLLVILILGLYLFYQLFSQVWVLFKYMDLDYQRLSASARMEQGTTQIYTTSVPYQII